ncbi:RNA polymerase II subunit 5-mediating protein-like [Heracleum sosnowskyi]|uniref:RNA polymerase II subunit 5-mediating protein-like n=1 Tax=Heracleum sosnowskyi TaxID=360622 RepID=A0AAD8JL81_9APIA|nr:RNA polymerase II subunit 5-mediating protein-like [Heracleum sosnowskyi]
MEKTEKKGTVTSLASLFPPEEARKASQRVLDTIAEHEKELNQLNEFISDNNSIIDLVQRIPEQLHHDIMVPFGKKAFFPGRLIHTNEFLVLLGESYYVDRTSKQTTEILKRRGNTLGSQVESLKAVMQDLKAEASFFDATASEAAEGLVEIREDYIEEASTETVSHTDIKTVDEDEEYARLLSRMDELEKQELEAENDDESDLEDADLEDQGNQVLMDHRVKNSEHEALKVQPASKVLPRTSEHSKVQTASTVLPQTSERSKVEPASKVLPHRTEPKKVQPALEDGSQNTNTAMPMSKSSISDKEQRNHLQHTPANEGSVRPSEPHFDSTKAFTGSIVERTHNIDSNPRGQFSSSPKTISRFKMQRKQP